MGTESAKLSGNGPARAAGCVDCGARGESFFCAAAAHGARVYPRGEVLFAEGQEPRGVYVLCRGRVKLYASSGEGRALITDISGPGDVLGLSAVVSGEPYEGSAETLDACRLRFIRREELLRLLEGRAEAALHAARQLSRGYRAAHRQAALLGLSGTAAGKLARVLLERRALGGPAYALTHEEIGQLIGASRETVTRLLGEFKRKRLVESAGTTLVVRDRPALEALARSS